MVALIALGVCVTIAVGFYVIAMHEVGLAEARDAADTVTLRECCGCGKFAWPGVQHCDECGSETLPVRAA